MTKFSDPITQTVLDYFEGWYEGSQDGVEGWRIANTLWRRR